MPFLAARMGPGHEVPRASTTLLYLDGGEVFGHVMLLCACVFILKRRRSRPPAWYVWSLPPGSFVVRSYAGVMGAGMFRRVEQLGGLQGLALRQVLLDQGLPHERARLHELLVGHVVVDGLTLLARGHEPALLEHAQVLRHVVDRDADLHGEVAHALLLAADGVEDGLPVLVGHGLAQLRVHTEEGLEVRRGGALRGRLCELVNLHTYLYTPIRMDESTETEPVRFVGFRALRLTSQGLAPDNRRARRGRSSARPHSRMTARSARWKNASNEK